MTSRGCSTTARCSRTCGPSSASSWRCGSTGSAVAYVRGEPYVQLDVDTSQNPFFRVSLGFRAIVGVDNDFFDIDYQRVVLDRSTVVATSASYPDNRFPWVTILGPDGFPPEVEQTLGSRSRSTDPLGPRAVRLLRRAPGPHRRLRHGRPLPDDSSSRWSARNIHTGEVRGLGIAGTDVARLTLPPGTWDVTGQVVRRVRQRAARHAGRRPGVRPAATRPHCHARDQRCGGRADPGPGRRDRPGDRHRRALRGRARDPRRPRSGRAAPAALGGAALLTNGSAAAAATLRQPSSPATPGSDDPGHRWRPAAAATRTSRCSPSTWRSPPGRLCLRFDYRFLSEEVPDFVGSRFNDAFVAELDSHHLVGVRQPAARADDLRAWRPPGCR